MRIARLARSGRWAFLTAGLLGGLYGLACSAAHAGEGGGGQPQPSPRVAQAPADGSTDSADEPDAAGAGEEPTTEPESPAAKPPAPPKPPSPPPPYPYRILFFENDFAGYFANPNAAPLLGEELKLMPLASEHVLSVGGELRHRYMDDHNRFRPEYPGDSTYQLWRWRQYFDYRYSDFLRGYAELRDASCFDEELPPQLIDVDRWDYNNLFVELKTIELWDKPVQFRFGRQELLLGSQRLVSPLDWANTRRTFEGFDIFRKGDDWDFHLFSTRPVVIHPESRDKGDASRTFSGAFAAYRGIENELWEAYWYWDREQEEVVGKVDGSRHTLGGRWLPVLPVRMNGKQYAEAWLLEVEGGYQCGHDNGETVQAGFLTTGIGYDWKALPWSPNFWCYFDWASGDRDPLDGVNNTFSQLFPLGHFYLGFFDGVARQNIRDYNCRFTVNPTKKLAFITWMHWFNLDQPTDAFYTVSGYRFARNAPGSPNVAVGQELDLRAIYTFSPNFDIMGGYSWFWTGNMLDNSVEGRRYDANFAYIQTSLRY